MGLAAAAVLGPAAASGLARAAKKRLAGEASSEDAFWFYVGEPTQVFGLEDYALIGQINPGNWYLCRGVFEDWAQMKDEDSDLEGWVSADAVHRAEPS